MSRFSRELSAQHTPAFLCLTQYIFVYMTKQAALAEKTATDGNAFDRATHFRKVSRHYCRLRTFDAAPLLEMHRSLPKHNGSIAGFDIGCGTGRYTLPFLRMLLESNPHLRAEMMLIDACRHMLDVARRRTAGLAGNVSFVRGNEETLAGYGNRFDFGMTTNAIHHLDIALFLRRVASALRAGGRLFVYTRTQEQNRRIIWGEHFPGFAERETRLLREGGMERLVADADELEVVTAKTFAYTRVSSLQRLLEQARGRHYSTFRFYTPQEFRTAIAKFERALRVRFPDTENIQHVDENSLYVIEKRSGTG